MGLSSAVVEVATLVALADKTAAVDSSIVVVADTVAADMAAWVAIGAGIACSAEDVAIVVAVVVADTYDDFLSRVLSQCEYNV
jgi:hypothetical protein